MGLDGGTIPTRGELVKVKEKPEQKNKLYDMLHKWKNCTLSHLPLEEPIVVCHLGMLYNKQSVLELLLGKIHMRERREFDHIESLRDVCQLKLNRSTTDECLHACPVTGLEMNGKVKFVCLWNCGCVLSDRAIRKVQSTTCHSCGQPWSEDDVVFLNPDEETLDMMRGRMVRRKLQKPQTKPQSGGQGENSDTGQRPSAAVKTDTAPLASGSSTKRPIDHDGSRQPDAKKSKKHKNPKKHKKHKTSETKDKPPKLHPGWSKFFP